MKSFTAIAVLLIASIYSLALNYDQDGRIKSLEKALSECRDVKRKMP